MTALRTLRVLPVVAALAFAGVSVQAQTGGTPSTTPTTGSSVTGGRAAPAVQPGTGTRKTETNKDDKLARGDRGFMNDAAGDGMFEVQAAQLAASKAQSPDVKDFANKLVADHQNANNELVQLANAKKVELPAAAPRGKRHELEKLAKLSGAAFDRQFVAHVGLKDHEADIKKFEKAAEKVKDADLKAWVQKALPQLREHHQMAQQLSKKLSGH